MRKRGATSKTKQMHVTCWGKEEGDISIIPYYLDTLNLCNSHASQIHCETIYIG